MLFSDGISVAEERRLKDLAEERSLLVMGPDCGTAIVSGVPLAFANQTAPGPLASSAPPAPASRPSSASSTPSASE